MNNPNCDGSGPCCMGEVRVLPHTANPHHGNSILCRNCFNRDIEYRIERNKDLAPENRYALPAWNDLKPYAP